MKSNSYKPYYNGCFVFIMHVSHIGVLRIMAFFELSRQGCMHRIKRVFIFYKVCVYS